MKTYLLTVLLLASAGQAAAQFSKEKGVHRLLANEISSPVEYREQPFDVLHYDAFLDMTKAPARDMRGDCEITLHWREYSDGDKFFFHLRSLKVDSAFYNGTKVSALESGTPSQASYHYEISPPAQVKKGDTARVRVYYSGQMTSEPGGAFGGVNTDGPLYALGVGIYANYVSATQHWLPCYDHPSDKATFRGSFRVKNDRIAASNGTLKLTADTDSTRIFEWTEAHPAATYLLTFAVAPYSSIGIEGMSVPGIIYADPADTAAARISFSKLPAMLAMMERRFGAYPYEKVGYVSTRKGAMEHQSMISINTRVVQEKDPENMIAMHELAHQWFGDLVTPEDFRHAWLSESFATYCESLWQEEMKGQGGYVADQEAKMNVYFDVAKSEGILSLHDFKRTSPSSNYPETIYKKGALVLGMLRYELGDSLFFGALKSYLDTYRFGNATTDKFQKVVEAYVGYSLKVFFDQWVYREGWPVLSVRIRPFLGFSHRYEVLVRQTGESRHINYFHVPLSVSYRDTSGVEKTDVVWLENNAVKFVIGEVWPGTALRFNKHLQFRTLMKIDSVDAGVLGVPGSAPQRKIEVIPNPASGDSRIFVEPSERSSELEVLDLTGRKIFSAEIPPGESGLMLPSAAFPQGVYLLLLDKSQYARLQVIK